MKRLHDLEPISLPGGVSIGHPSHPGQFEQVHDWVEPTLKETITSVENEYRISFPPVDLFRWGSDQAPISDTEALSRR